MRCRFSDIVVLSASFLLPQAARGAANEFPFEFREGLLWVEVRTADSTKPLHFLLDSGAQVGVVNLSTAKRLGLSLGNPVGVRSVEAATTGYWPQKLSLNVGDVKLPSELLALDLSKLNRACSQPVDGLIGADFFKGRIVQIDFDAHKIRVLKGVDASSGSTSLSLESRRCGLCVMASIDGGTPQRFRVDTGCATALQWVTASVPLERCTSKVAIGVSELSIPQAQATVELGGRIFRDVPAGLHRDAIFEGESGLLGNGLLSRFKSVTFDGNSFRLILSDLRSSN